MCTKPLYGAEPLNASLLLLLQRLASGKGYGEVGEGLQMALGKKLDVTTIASRIKHACEVRKLEEAEGLMTYWHLMRQANIPQIARLRAETGPNLLKYGILPRRVRVTFEGDTWQRARMSAVSTFGAKIVVPEYVEPPMGMEPLAAREESMLGLGAAGFSLNTMARAMGWTFAETTAVAQGLFAKLGVNKYSSDPMATATRLAWDAGLLLVGRAARLSPDERSSLGPTLHAAARGEPLPVGTATDNSAGAEDLTERLARIGVRTEAPATLFTYGHLSGAMPYPGYSHIVD